MYIVYIYIYHIISYIYIYILHVYNIMGAAKKRPESVFHISRASLEHFNTPRVGLKYRRSLN